MNGRRMPPQIFTWQKLLMDFINLIYDTYENSFVSWAVKNIIEKLRRYRIHIENSDKRQQYTAISDRINYFQGRLQGIINSSHHTQKIFKKIVSNRA
jgi:hypothetical protein